MNLPIRIDYRSRYPFYGIAVAALGIAVIVVSQVYNVSGIKFGTWRLPLPDGVANLIMLVGGVLVVLSAIHHILKSIAANAHGHAIQLDETSMTFTLAEGYRGTLVTIPYSDLTKIVLYDEKEDSYIQIFTANLKHKFDIEDIHPASDFKEKLVPTLKVKALNADFVTK
jgi:hypothetical protein